MSRLVQRDPKCIGAQLLHGEHHRGHEAYAAGREGSGSKMLPAPPGQPENSGLGSTLLMTPYGDCWSANSFHGVCWVFKGQAGYIGYVSHS